MQIIPFMIATGHYPFPKKGALLIYAFLTLRFFIWVEKMNSMYLTHCVG